MYRDNDPKDEPMAHVRWTLKGAIKHFYRGPTPAFPLFLVAAVAALICWVLLQEFAPRAYRVMIVINHVYLVCFVAYFGWRYWGRAWWRSRK